MDVSCCVSRCTCLSKTEQSAEASPSWKGLAASVGGSAAVASMGLSIIPLPCGLRCRPNGALLSTLHVPESHMARAAAEQSAQQMPGESKALSRFSWGTACKFDDRLGYCPRFNCLGWMAAVWGSILGDSLVLACGPSTMSLSCQGALQGHRWHPREGTSQMWPTFAAPWALLGLVRVKCGVTACAKAGSSLAFPKGLL